MTTGTISAQTRKPTPTITGRYWSKNAATIAAKPRKPSVAFAVTASDVVHPVSTASVIFFCAEVTAFQAGGSTITFEYGYATTPVLALAQLSDGPVVANSITYASDLGYRTSANDGDPVVYPPILIQEFQIDRRINLPPNAAGIAAAWGTLSLENLDNQFASLPAGYNNDGRNINILYGFKSLENYNGYTIAGIPARSILLDPAYATLQPIFTGVQSPWFLSDKSLDIPLRDITYWMQRPLQTNLYLGTGSYAGSATLASLPLPMTRGGTAGNPVRNVTPTLIDPVNLVYQYSDGPGTLVTLWEGGAVTYAFTADTANLFAGSTTAGHYRTDVSRSCFQLGSIPTGQITCDVTGAFPTAGAQSNAITIARYLLSETLQMSNAYINTASFTTQNAAYPVTSGFYYGSNDNPTGIDGVNQILFGLGAKLYAARGGQLKVMVLRSPSGSSTGTLDSSNCESVIPTTLDAAVNPPPYRIRVGYNHNHTVMTTGILGNATATQRAYVATSDPLAGAVSATIQSNYLRPNDLPPVTGAVLSNSSATTIATDLIALWGTRRRLYLVTTPVTVGIQHDLGDLVTLAWALDDLPAGKLGIIVGETFSSVDATLTFTIMI